MRNPVTNKRAKQTMADFVFSCGIVQAIRRYPRFYHGSTGTIILIVPEGASQHDYVKPACLLLDPRPEDFRSFESPYAVFTIDGDESPREAAKKALQLASKSKAILFSENAEEIPSEFLLQADAVISLSPPSPKHLAAGCRVLFDVKMSDEQAVEILTYPLNAVWSSIKRHRSIAETLEKLKTYTPPKPDPELAKPAPRRLEDMYGYGSAKDWGLNLAADLAAWKAGGSGLGGHRQRLVAVGSSWLRQDHFCGGSCNNVWGDIGRKFACAMAGPWSPR